MRFLASGKTKKIWEWPGDLSHGRVESFNDITAGDGAKHDQFENKAVYATTTTCNVFTMLNSLGIPTAYVRKLSSTEFIAKRCRMLPYEVVQRRIALGSYLKRNTFTNAGTRFDPPVCEFFLKTRGMEFNGISLAKVEKDDPLISLFPDPFDNRRGVFVRPPHRPSSVAECIFIPSEALGWPELGNETTFDHLRLLSYWTFVSLEHAWRKLGYTLADLKIEFGLTLAGELVVSDVIDNDSWRVITVSGEHLDKQLYRDGASLEVVAGKYKEVAMLSERFLD